jgi:O-methyltransferase
MKRWIQNILKSQGYILAKSNGNSYPDFEPEFAEIQDKASSFTMTSPERMYAFYQATKYIIQNNIAGDIVECGVWKGGSSMVSALTLLKSNSADRDIYLYDTYEGMTDPSEKDVSFDNKSAKKNWDLKRQVDNKIFCYSTLEEVQTNLFSTGYPKGEIHFVKGKVEETIPSVLPNKIAILRLDTDWYESTYHELKYLYPLLVSDGVLIIDDYGHWKGAREAVDRYFTEIGLNPLLHRIDYTGRMMIKS